MIEIKNLVKFYSKLKAVDIDELKINSRECFALLGLNGAGKTTLINILSTQFKATSGEVKVDGLDIVKDKHEIRKMINICPQEIAVAKNLTVKENFVFIADLYKIKEKDEKISKLIKKFELEDKTNVLAKKLSGGQLKRLSLGLAILTNPKILFLDEPTLGLDVKSRRNLWNIISELKQDVTIVLTTHYLDEVEFLADRVAIMSKGKIKIVGTCEEIIKKAKAETFEDAFINLTEE